MRLRKNVAPTARIYLHLICRKRHLPLKGKTIGCGAKLSIALSLREATTVLSAVSNRDTRDICIRSCPNAPLKTKKDAAQQENGNVFFVILLRRTSD